MISLPRNIIALLVGAGMLLSPILACAVPCADVFPTPANVVSATGVVTVHGSVLNTSGGHLAVDGGNLSVSGNCDGGACVAAGHAEPMSLPANDGRDGILTVGWNETKVFTAGDYYYTGASLSDGGKLEFSGSGTARIHIDTDLDLMGEVNSGGSAEHMLFFVDGDLSSGGTARTRNALFYVSGDATMASGTIVGAITAANVQVNGGTTLQFDQNAVDNADFGGACSGGVAPVLEYRFDECFWNGSAGEVVDHVSGLNGVAVNGASTAPSGDVGGGICDVGSFSGHDYVDGGDILNNVFGTGSSAFTVTAWIKPHLLGSAATNHGTRNTFIAKASDPFNDNLELGITQDGKLHVYIDTVGKDTQADIGGGITVGAWHFVAVTYDNGVVRVNIDGVESSSSAWNGGGQLDNAAGSPFTVASSQHYDNYFTGNVDEVKVYAQPLSGAQVEQIRLNEAAGNNYDGSARVCNCVRPLADYRFDACSLVGGVTDASGSGYNGIVQGGMESVSGGMICRGGGFDGVDDYVELPGFPNLQNSFTVIAWVRTGDRSKVGQRIFADDENNSTGYAVSIGDGGAGTVRFYDRSQSGNGVIDSAAVINDDTWYLVAAVADVDGGRRHLYVLDQTGAVLDHQEQGFSAPASRDGGMATIGGETASSSEAGRKFAGRIDEVKVFGIALGEQEIKNICVNEANGNDYDGRPRNCDCCRSYTGPIEPIHFEGGTVALINTYNHKKWTHITFAQPFDEPPVVFIVLEAAGSDPAAPRIRNITINGFDAVIAEPQGEDGPHISQTVNYFAINKGIHRVGDELLLVDSVDTKQYQQASHGVSVSDAWIEIPQYLFCNPVVVANIQELANESSTLPNARSIPWLTSAVKVDSGRVYVALERSETDEGGVSNAETIGYMMAEGNVQTDFIDDADNKIWFETIKTGRLFVGWDDGCRSVSFVNNYTKAPLIAASMNSKNEADGGWLRRCALNKDVVGFRIDEDRYYRHNYNNASPPQDAERNHVPEVGGIFVFSDNFVLIDRLNHFKIEHDGTAINCLPEEITISAHDKSHNVLAAYAGTIELSTSTNHGNWLIGSGKGVLNNGSADDGAATYTFDASDNGVVKLLFSDTHLETVDIDVEDGIFSERSGTAAADEDPVLEIKDSGFVFHPDNDVNADIGTQICGKYSNTGHNSHVVHLVAMATDNASGTCAAALDGNVTVELGYECIDPATCSANRVDISAGGITTTLAGTAAAAARVYTEVPLTFDADGAELALNYHDAGKIKLFARYVKALEIDANGERVANTGLDLEGDSNEFVVRPFGIYFNVVDNPAAQDENGGKFIAAGKEFKLNLAAVCWQSGDDSDSDGVPDGHNDDDPANNADLSNNGIADNAVGTVTISHLLWQPTGGVAGSLGGTTAPLLAAGRASSDDLTYSEVGIMELHGVMNDYLGGGEGVSGRSGAVGRFIPDHFRAAVENDGEFANACTGFTYIGQLFGYASGEEPELKITAENYTGATTQNYRDGFVKLTSAQPPQVKVDMPASDSSQHGVAAGNPLLNVTVSADAPTLDANDDGTLTFKLGSDDKFTYLKEGNALVAPFSTDLAIEVAQIKDSDAVEAINLPGDATFNPAAVTQRFGRLRVINAHGSELLPLDMHVVAEYFDGNTFVPASDDNCTVLDSTNFTFTSHPGTIPSPQVGSWSNGGITLQWHNPPYDPGYVDVDIDLSAQPWLQFDWDNDGVYDDSPVDKRATFGIYKGSEHIIYLRETTWR